MSELYQSNNILSKKNLKNNFVNNSLNNNNVYEHSQLHHSPKKLLENIQNNKYYNNNITPFNFGYNYFFGNLWTFGAIPNNQSLQQQIILNPLSIEKNFNMIQNFQINENINNNIINNFNNNNIILNQNNNINKLYEINNIYNFNNINNINNINELNNKNLNVNNNNAKNNKILYDGNNSYCNKTINNISNIEFNNKINNKNDTLQISKQTIHYCPSSYAKNNISSQKVNDCSDGSTLITKNSIDKTNKIKKYRKNNGQIYCLRKFYEENKHWSKKQIKEISQKIGLKESKVYKWLWDKRNKDIKSKTFIIKKDIKK